MAVSSGKPGTATRDSGAAPDSWPRRVFVVAGMHRAGTSVIARGLQALGIDLGNRLMSADLRVNARGFFEDKDIVSLDDALLEASGADWKNTALLDDVDWSGPALAIARADARRLLETRLSAAGQFGFKDPRVARLLPFWQRVFADLGVADAYVIAVRHPLSVVESLTARDTLDTRRSAGLWLTHLVCALHYTAGRPRVVVDYDRLLAAPVHELARVAKGLRWPAPAPDREAVQAYAGEFLAKELRHAEHSYADLGAAATLPLLGRACALAQRLACDEADAGSAATDAEVAALFLQLVALSPLLAYAGATERCADDVPRLRGELDWARTSLADASTFSESLQAALRNKEAEQLVAQRHGESLAAVLQRKDEALASAQAYGEDLRANLREKDGALASARAYSEGLQAALRAKGEALASAQAYGEGLQAALRAKDEALASAQAYGEDLQAALRAKDEALASAQAYGEDLQVALRAKDEALASAQAYGEDLQAALRAKDAALTAVREQSEDLQAALRQTKEALSSANEKLGRIRDRFLGRMLLRRVER